MILNWQESEAVCAGTEHVIVYGPPGFGKTFLACATAQSRELFQITLTEETASAELRGHYIPRANEFVWHDGPAISAWRVGGRIVANEIDRASGDALSFMFGLLDDPKVARLSLPSGETVRPAAGFSCIATTNAVDLESALPEALLNRFSTRILIDELHPAALDLLASDLRDACKASVSATDGRAVSYRQWSAFDRLRTIHGADIASRAVFGERAADILNSLLIAKAGK